MSTSPGQPTLCMWVSITTLYGNQFITSKFLCGLMFICTKPIIVLCKNKKENKRILFYSIIIFSFYLLSAEVNYGIRFSDWGEAEQFISQLASEVRYTTVGADQCCGSGMSIPHQIFFHAKSRGAEIKMPLGAGAENKLPPGAGAEITNCGSSSGSFLFITDLKKFYRKTHGKLLHF
jgi:hypothetical protein